MIAVPTRLEREMIIGPGDLRIRERGLALEEGKQIMLLREWIHSLHLLPANVCHKLQDMARRLRGKRSDMDPTASWLCWMAQPISGRPSKVNMIVLFLSHPGAALKEGHSLVQAA